MKYFLFLFFFTLFYSIGKAQDSIKLSTRSFDTSLFAKDDTLTENDYLTGLGKMFQTLNKATAVSQYDGAILDINHHLDEDDSAINIIKKRISPIEKILNIRDIQMFHTLLTRIYLDTKTYNLKLTQLDSELDAAKNEIFGLRKDTIAKHIFGSSSLMASYKLQLSQLYIKWKNADSVIKKSNHSIDKSLARTSSNLIVVTELLSHTKALLNATSISAFKKESSYLWEANSNPAFISPSKYKSALHDEMEIVKYYFKDTMTQLYLLLATGLLFFYWIFYNYNSIKDLHKLNAFDILKLKYGNSFPVFSALIFLLSIAPLFDLNAPSIYIEIIVLVLMVILTIHFWRKLPGQMFFLWMLFIILFNLILFIRLLRITFIEQRIFILFISTISVVTGIFTLINWKKFYSRFKPLYWIGGLYIIFNLAAVLCNLLGRITLMNIFSMSAINAFVQAIGLMIFVEATKEAFILQIQGSRIRKGYPDYFDFKDISKGIVRMVSIIAVLIWLIVLTTNLNMYNSLSDKIISTLTFHRKLGSFTFTFSGIILFLLIIWCANFLQKYIAYFFGDLGEDAAFENVGQRSTLLITRLILLIAGFLLAVVASGLAIDRITVILGALSVGIGLGLQSIVNNFVSGVILIFDRPMRIGDTVEISGKRGRVKEISVRTSTLLTPDGAEVIIPNGSILANNIVNWTLSNSHIRAEITFTLNKINNSIDLKTDIDKIVRSTPNVLAQKAPEIFIGNISSSAVELKIYFWCKEVARLEHTRSQVYQSVYSNLAGKGIIIL